MFSQIKGQDRAIKLLNNSIQHNRISQAYLFYGPEGVGKFTTALYYGMALNCLSASTKRPCGACASCHKFIEFSQTDLTYIFPTPNLKLTDEGVIKESKYISEYNDYIENRKHSPWKSFFFSSKLMIRKESIIMLQRRLELAQTEGAYRVCIVEDADEMNEEASNSFLKTLEEPPSNTVIILTTTKMQSLLPTIVSRCQLVYFQPLSHKVIEDMLTSKYLIDKTIAKTYSRISNGNLEQAIRLTGDSKQESRNLMIAIVEAALKKDDMFVINMVSSVKEKYKAELMHDLLFHLALWFNDMAKLYIDRKDINSLDQLELLEKCLKNNPDWDTDIPNSLSFIDDLHRKIDGNVNIQLILINLYNHLRKNFNK